MRDWDTGKGRLPKDSSSWEHKILLRALTQLSRYVHVLNPAYVKTCCMIIVTACCGVGYGSTVNVACIVCHAVVVSMLYAWQSGSDAIFRQLIFSFNAINR